MIHHRNKQNYMATNKRMKAARVLKGVTQLQLAELVGLKEIEVSRFETGRGTPSPENRQRIAIALGKPAWEIFDA
jgi:transcriptional regulator with XRE-family HTH domain